ncbi:MAG: acyl-CoA thioester hydrolase/BAAT C-terminal domain-containing protein [Nostocoides sp.]
MPVEQLTGPEGVLVTPDDGDVRGAVLVLSGSSGRVQADRCRVLADHKLAALSLRWFGEVPQPASLQEVPIESFRPSLDRLAGLSDRLGLVGTSFGALAALLLGIADERLNTVVALAPSHLVWATPTLTVEDKPIERSAFSWQGDPLHFMPGVDQTTWHGPDFTTLRQAYEASLRTFPTRERNAVIAVEQITADLIVASGGDDAVWPSAAAAQQIKARRAAYGMDTTVLHEPEAGHRVILPGEPPAQPTQGYPYGGVEAADRRLGNRVLAALLASLPLAG